MAVLLAPVPALACFAGIEESLRRLPDRPHCSSFLGRAARADCLRITARLAPETANQLRDDDAACDRSRRHGKIATLEAIMTCLLARLKSSLAARPKPSSAARLKPSRYVVIALVAMAAAVRAQNPAQPLTDTPPPREPLTPAPSRA